MKKLYHNGVFVPERYRSRGLHVTTGEGTYKLTDEAEEMAIAWCRKLDTPHVEDPVFRENFFSDFCRKLGIGFTQAIDFQEIISALEGERLERENLPKQERRRKALENRKVREERRERFGYASVDGKKVEVSNWIAEPSSIFLGRGKHPLRGRWKRGPGEGEVTLNLSPEASRPEGDWKAVEWNPRGMYVAYWEDKLTGKRKYAWLSDTWEEKQEREKAKFDKARELEENLEKVKHLIEAGIHSPDQERRRIATICYLIYHLNLRVGDEKIPGEADTVGAITLRPEHLSFNSASKEVTFSFLGKDSVEWKRSLTCGDQAFTNLLHYSSSCKGSLFEGETSRRVSKFLQEAMQGLTAKVFRTWRISRAVKDCLERGVLERTDREWLKKTTAKIANLRGAMVANHKRKIPSGFEEVKRKKEDRLRTLLKEIKEAGGEEAKRRKEERYSKEALGLSFYESSKEYTLSTSLRSYIDPRIYREWCEQVDLDPGKIYSKALLKKFSWCFGSNQPGYQGEKDEIQGDTQ